MLCHKEISFLIQWPNLVYQVKEMAKENYFKANQVVLIIGLSSCLHVNNNSISNEISLNTTFIIIK